MRYKSDETIQLTFVTWKYVDETWQFFSAKQKSGFTLQRQPHGDRYYWQLGGRSGRATGHFKSRVATNGIYEIETDALVVVGGKKHKVGPVYSAACRFVS